MSTTLLWLVSPGQPSRSRLWGVLQVDFFGANIKALEFSQQISAMRLLSSEVTQLSDPYKMFRIDEETLLAPPKWAPANGWTVQDDAMLLLGSQIHGIGFWERIAADERLELRHKLAGAVKDGAKVGDKNFPQGAILLIALFWEAS